MNFMESTKPTAVVVREATNTIGRVIATHTYPDAPVQYASVRFKKDESAEWLAVTDLRAATAEEVTQINW